MFLQGMSDDCSKRHYLKIYSFNNLPLNLRYINVFMKSPSFQITHYYCNTVDLGCNEIKSSELEFRYNQGFATDKVLISFYVLSNVI